MKVYVDFSLNGTGKSKFIERLIPALEKIDVICSFNPKGCDVGLGVAWQNSRSKGMPYVLRMDGVSFEKGKKYVEHVYPKIKDSIKNANSIIWQSAFCKRILGELFGVKESKKQYIIFNGANPEAYKKIPTISCVYPRRIIMSAHWYKKGKERTSKRLREMLEIVEEHCSNRSDTCAWVAGETNLKSPSDKVFMLGHLPEGLLRSYLASSTIMLYLAQYDWCPNAVVESLVAGTPVICSNNSGVAEIVGEDGGVALPIDEELNLADLYHPPAKMPKSYVLETLDIMGSYRVFKPELFIDNIAQQYKQVFLETLK